MPSQPSKPSASQPTVSKPSASQPTVSRPSVSQPTVSRPSKPSQPSASRPVEPTPAAPVDGEPRQVEPTPGEHQPAAVAAVPDVKEQFRLALERKRTANADSHGNTGAGGAKISSTHGRASNKREFRRKSGG